MKKVLEKIRSEIIGSDHLSWEVILRLARAVEYRDSQMSFHIVRISYYAQALAKKIGWNQKNSQLIMTASSLHDIGKVAIPDYILHKKTALTIEEWTMMKTHPIVGAELLSGNNSKFFMMAREIALTHHERWDGGGYPHGLKEENIPLAGRICCLCDVFDALMTQRPYKRAWTLEETTEEIKDGKGSHFDPFLADVFLEILPEINHIREKYADPL